MSSADLDRERAKWTFTGRERPPFAAAPGPGEESVWDYPRPPRIVADERDVRVEADGTTIARSTRALRVLETASPPVFYLPSEDIEPGALSLASGRSLCEWKGEARYADVRGRGKSIAGAAWCYPKPFSGYERLVGYFGFYPSRVDCFVGDERARPQPGEFYAGWVTSEITGPFKGEPGTESW